MVALGLRCCLRAFSSCGAQGLLFGAVLGLLIVVASLVAEHRLRKLGLQSLQHVGSVAWSLVALSHVESSRTRDRTRVPCFGRQILIHCSTKEALCSLHCD